MTSSDLQNCRPSYVEVQITVCHQVGQSLCTMHFFAQRYRLNSSNDHYVTFPIRSEKVSESTRPPNPFCHTSAHDFVRAPQNTESCVIRYMSIGGRACMCIANYSLVTWHIELKINQTTVSPYSQHVQLTTVEERNTKAHKT